MTVTNQGSQDQGSMKSQLAALGLPALMLADGLMIQNGSSSDFIVAGGQETALEALQLTHLCNPCTPGVIVPGLRG